MANSTVIQPTDLGRLDISIESTATQNTDPATGYVITKADKESINFKLTPNYEENPSSKDAHGSLAEEFQKTSETIEANWSIVPSINELPALLTLVNGSTGTADTWTVGYTEHALSETQQTYHAKVQHGDAYYAAGGCVISSMEETGTPGETIKLTISGDAMSMASGATMTSGYRTQANSFRPYGASIKIDTVVTNVTGYTLTRTNTALEFDKSAGTGYLTKQVQTQTKMMCEGTVTLRWNAQTRDDGNLGLVDKIKNKTAFSFDIMRTDGTNYWRSLMSNCIAKETPTEPEQTGEIYEWTINFRACDSNAGQYDWIRDEYTTP